MPTADTSAGQYTREVNGSVLLNVATANPGNVSKVSGSNASASSVSLVNTFTPSSIIVTDPCGPINFLDSAIKTGDNTYKLVKSILVERCQTLTIPQGVTLTMTEQFCIRNRTTVVNNGTIICDNAQSSINYADSIFENNGTLILNNGSEYRNYGCEIINNGTITLGTVRLDQSNTYYVPNTYYLVDYTTLTNNGKFNIENGSRILLEPNDDIVTISNEESGEMMNKGSISGIYFVNRKKYIFRNYGTYITKRPTSYAPGCPTDDNSRSCIPYQIISGGFNNGKMIISGELTFNLGRTFINRGTIDISDECYINGDNITGKFINDTDGLINVFGGGLFNVIYSSGVDFTNDGVVNIADGTYSCGIGTRTIEQGHEVYDGDGTQSNKCPDIVDVLLSEIATFNRTEVIDGQTCHIWEIVGETFTLNSNERLILSDDDYDTSIMYILEMTNNHRFRNFGKIEIAELSAISIYNSSFTNGNSGIVRATRLLHVVGPGSNKQFINNGFIEIISHTSDDEVFDNYASLRFIGGYGLYDNFNVLNTGTILTHEKTIFEILAPFTNSGKILSSSSRFYSDQTDSLIQITNDENAVIILSGAGITQFFKYNQTQGTLLINNGDIYVTDDAQLRDVDDIVNNGIINIANGTGLCGQGSKEPFVPIPGSGLEGTECPEDPCLILLSDIATPDINNNKIYTLNANLTINNCKKLIIRIGFTLIIPIGLTITNLEKIDIYGILHNEGTIINSGTIIEEEARGSTINNGVINNKNSGLIIINNFSQTGNAFINRPDIIITRGILNNEGKIDVRAASLIIEKGDLNNFNKIVFNSNSVISITEGTFNNSGNIINESNSTLNIKGGKFKNIEDGNLINDGEIILTKTEIVNSSGSIGVFNPELINSTGCTITNNSIFRCTNGFINNFGRFNNHNTIYNNTTSFTNEFGSSFFNIGSSAFFYNNKTSYVFIRGSVSSPSGSDSEFVIQSGSTFFNNSSLDDDDQIKLVEYQKTQVFNQSKLFKVYGTINNFGTFISTHSEARIEEGGTFLNKKGIEYESSDGKFLGGISNYGIFTNDSNLECFLSFNNFRTFTNNGHIETTANVAKTAFGRIVNYNFLTTNNGTILNNGIIISMSARKIINFGTITNNYRITIDGFLDNNGTITTNNDGRITISTNGFLSNYATIVNKFNSTLLNDGKFTNFNGGMFEYSGLPFTNQGNLTNAYGGLIELKNIVSNSATLVNKGTIRSTVKLNLLSGLCTNDFNAVIFIYNGGEVEYSKNSFTNNGILNISAQSACCAPGINKSASITPNGGGRIGTACAISVSNCPAIYSQASPIMELLLLLNARLSPYIESNGITFYDTLYSANQPFNYEIPANKTYILPPNIGLIIGSPNQNNLVNLTISGKLYVDSHLGIVSNGRISISTSGELIVSNKLSVRGENNCKVNNLGTLTINSGGSVLIDNGKGEFYNFQGATVHNYGDLRIYNPLYAPYFSPDISAYSEILYQYTYNSLFENKGTFINYTGSILNIDSNCRFLNDGVGTITNSGTIQNIRTLTRRIPYTLASTYSGINEDSSAFFYQKQGTLINNEDGKIIIQSKFLVNGTIENSGLIENNKKEFAKDDLEVNGTITNLSGGRIVNNDKWKINDNTTFNNASGSTFTNNVTFTFPKKTTILSCNLINNAIASFPSNTTLAFSATITNSGTLNFIGTLTNLGTLNYSGIITNQGTLNNGGTINFDTYVITSLLNNNIGGIINIKTDKTLTINNSLTNYGTINNNGTLRNNSGITNASGSIITNDGIHYNDGGIVNTGVYYNNLTFTNASSFTITGGTLTNTGTLTNSNTGTVNNNSGFLTNSGTLTNLNTITINNGAFLINTGTLTNTGGALTIGGTLTNTGGTLTNSNTITIIDGGTLTNTGGTLTNSNTITINNGATLFIYAGTLTNSGIITINGTLTNTGTLTNSYTLTIGGTLTNTGTLTNSNTLTIGGTLTNTGTVNNNSGLIQNNGTVNNNTNNISTGKIINKGNFFNKTANLYNNGTFDNDLTGVFRYTDDNGGGSRFTNTGILNLKNGSLFFTSNSNTTFTNISTLNMSGGTLNVDTILSIFSFTMETGILSTIFNNSIITFNNSFTLHGRIINYNVLNINAPVTNIGELQNDNADARMNINNLLTNSSLIKNQRGKITMAGTGIVTNNLNSSMDNYDLIDLQKTLTNNGTITNYLTSTATFTIFSNGTLNNNNLIQNNRSFTSNGTLNNNTNSQIINTADFTINHSGVTTNNGTIKNKGNFYEFGETFTNNNLIENDGITRSTNCICYINGSFINESGSTFRNINSSKTAITQFGSFLNKSTTIFNSGSQLFNEGRFVNRSLVEFNGIELFNSGEIDNETSSSIMKFKTNIHNDKFINNFGEVHITDTLVDLKRGDKAGSKFKNFESGRIFVYNGGIIKYSINATDPPDNVLFENYGIINVMRRNECYNKGYFSETTIPNNFSGPGMLGVDPPESCNIPSTTITTAGVVSLEIRHWRDNLYYSRFFFSQTLATIQVNNYYTFPAGSVLIIRYNTRWVLNSVFVNNGDMRIERSVDAPVFVIGPEGVLINNGTISLAGPMSVSGAFINNSGAVVNLDRPPPPSTVMLGEIVTASGGFVINKPGSLIQDVFEPGGSGPSGPSGP